MSVSENELETIERRRKGDLKAKMIRDNKRNGVDNSTNRNIHALCLSSEISLSLEHTKNANIIFRVIPSGMWINLYYNVCVCCNYRNRVLYKLCMHRIRSFSLCERSAHFPWHTIFKHFRQCQNMYILSCYFPTLNEQSVYEVAHFLCMIQCLW